MQVEMRWQKPENPTDCVYVQGCGNEKFSLSYGFYEAATWHIATVDEIGAWERLGDRLVCYIPGPPPEGQTEADEDEDCDLATAHAELDEMLEVWDSEIPWHRNYREGRALIRGVSLTTYYEIGRCLRVRDAHPTWAYNDDGVWRPLDSGVCYIDELPRKGGV